MRYVVIGASAAGINGAKRLRELDPKAEIVLISKDDAIYSRCILHHYIAKHRSLEQLRFVAPRFIEEHQITWLKGEEVIKLDAQAKVIATRSNKTLSFDKLLIAAGGHVRFPDIPHLKEATNAIGLHSLSDCAAIIDAAKRAKSIVIMGAGLVGIDAVTAFLPQINKKNITLVELKPHLLAMQLDARAASVYEKAFADAGVKQIYDVKIDSLTVNARNKIKKIQLSNGEILPCDLLVVASGTAANVDFLTGSGLKVDKFGLVIDKYGQTSHPDIFGAGDITGLHPIWPVAVKEGIIAASNMFGVCKELDHFFISKSTMNFMDIPTMSLGTPNIENCEVLIDEDSKGNYKKIVHKDGKIVGAILQGNLDYSGVLTQLIANKIDVSKVKKPIFKINYADFFKQTKDLEFIYKLD